ncbi:hypothetical protein [Rhizobium indigoferae]|uniref:Uncharacterized protein n=1 Tax=Rhizobium indigoferae TaxID=158891 RepID=A0ABZ1DT66_9HYPH|nr:hypothetical protein [Rhizobium indigoferae]NNU58256.1 hypothetical protein [Rhizobium indigoferae]WRW39389.1 hypothetical protein U5G49_006465 [Rhizobium indigoferae]GLR56773.1 hypothetical protein GCM10007919_14970 [Rhizobium indigoferae]
MSAVSFYPYLIPFSITLADATAPYASQPSVTTEIAKGISLRMVKATLNGRADGLVDLSAPTVGAHAKVER